MVPTVKTLRQARTDVRLHFVAACALLSMSGPVVAGCSNDEPNSGTSDPTAADPPPVPGQQPTAGAGTGGTPGQQTGAAGSAGTQGGQAGSMGPMANAGSGGDTPPEPEPMPDCTPVTWDNPGGVDDPMIVAVAADAGTTGKPFEQTAGLDEYDYVMDEFLFSGTSPAYTTRMMVRRPRDAAKFSGTVFVEWYNVSGGIDFAVLWANSREYFMREGHVFVGVSAQTVGATALRDYDAERYGPINHPGDTAANAIFSQAGVAIRTQSEALLGPCMPVHAMLALGQSQSSARLTAYVNDTHDSDQVYDGFMLHSGGEPASNDPGVPVVVVLTMSEGNGSRSDRPHRVKWVVAGATHNDERVTSRGAEVGEAIGAVSIECANPLNKYPSYRAYNAALDGLQRWVREGTKPPSGMPFEAPGGQLAVDEHDNVLGGVRTPHIDVPIATYGFDNAPANSLDFVALLACGLGGTTIPFSESKLLELYPTHEDYVEKYTTAADEALAEGYLLQADYDEVVEQAQAAPIPN